MPELRFAHAGEANTWTGQRRIVLSQVPPLLRLQAQAKAPGGDDPAMSRLPVGARCRCGGTIVEIRGQVGCSKCGTFDMPMPMTDDEFDAKMRAMPLEWRYRWCGGDPREYQGFSGCACLGGANCSGGLGWSAEMYDRWRAWVEAHPDSRPAEAQAEIERRVRDPKRLPE